MPNTIGEMETMSTVAAQPEYAALLARTLPAVIHSKKENERCISMLEALDRKGGLLTVLIEDFEDQARAHPGPAGRVMCGLIQANELRQKDLLDIFGTPSIVSEALREKRGLTVEHIRKLSRRFHVSPEVSF
jgi:HTH-type transcriptional regulator / antitoxin HigA